MRRAGGITAAALVFFASGLDAQWAVGRGEHWVKLSVFHHATEERFDADGDVRPFLGTDARSSSTAVFLDAVYGLHDRVDLWVQLPYFDLHFDDAADDRHSAGFGDVRASLRYAVPPLFGVSVPLALRVGAKAPIRDFPIDAEIIPVGEGQWDLEAIGELGVSFWPTPAYGVLWLGYRWRLENTETTRDPGAEKVLLAELGGRLFGAAGAKLTLDGTFGANGSIQGIRLGQDRREILYLQPALTYALGGGFSLEAGARFPLHGRNHPAGSQLVAALFRRSR